MAILKKETFQMDTNKSQMRILPRIPNDPGLPYYFFSAFKFQRDSIIAGPIENMIQKMFDILSEILSQSWVRHSLLACGILLLMRKYAGNFIQQV
jgi:hypothetical protein